MQLWYKYKDDFLELGKEKRNLSLLRKSLRLTLES